MLHLNTLHICYHSQYFLVHHVHSYHLCISISNSIAPLICSSSSTLHPWATPISLFSSAPTHTDISFQAAPPFPFITHYNRSTPIFNHLLLPDSFLIHCPYHLLLLESFAMATHCYNLIFFPDAPIHTYIITVWSWIFLSRKPLWVPGIKISSLPF